MKLSVSFWNGVIVACLAAMLLIFAFDRFAPPPKSQKSVSARVDQERRVRNETLASREATTNDRALVAKYTWSGDDKSVGASALARVTALAKSNKVSLGAFRPQKPMTDAGLARLPFVVSLEGPYPAMLAFLRALETPGNKLAVNLVQMTSADGASDTVVATIGLFAFQEPSKANVKLPPAKSTSTP